VAESWLSTATTKLTELAAELPTETIPEPTTRSGLLSATILSVQPKNTTVEYMPGYQVLYDRWHRNAEGTWIDLIP